MAALCVLVLAVSAPLASAQRAVREREASGGGGGDFAAHRLYERANDLLNAGEEERGVKMLETVLDQYPASDIKYKIWLALGKHFLGQHQHPRAINYLRNIRAIQKPDEQLSAEQEDIYLESMYLTGVAFFQLRQYGAAFPILRKITSDHPNTVWANQAYYYIGMCHFAQENWNKAIEALSVVGTFIDPDSPSVQYVEAGRRFYVKVSDTDLPVLYRLGNEIKLTIRSTSGDEEVVTCVPLSGGGEIFIGSITTEIGAPKKGDNVLQIIGGDKITTAYTDTNTYAGQANVERKTDVRVVSTAVVSYTLGDYSSRAGAAFIGQPLFVHLHDADKDVTTKADSVTVRLVSRYREVEEDNGSAGRTGINLERLFQDESEQWRVRDEVVLKLTELGEGDVVRTGRFGGSQLIEAFRPDIPIDRTDGTLTIAIDDEIVATFVDELHIAGESAREVTASIRVASEIDSKPRATQYVVSDPVLMAKKNLVEAEAYLELGKIFKSMGLEKGAKEKCDEGLTRVDVIIRTRQPIPAELNEHAFKLKWELFLVKDDYASAIATCQLFNRLYPDSPFVDQALLKIGMIKIEDKEYQQAINIFRQVLALAKSQVKAEAQFRIAEAVEATALQRGRGIQEAIAEYKKCAQQYPDSEFAGISLAKLIDYFIETRDYAQADDLLDQVFQDYPDAQFLDSMLLKWVMVAYRMGNFQKAFEKCESLIMEYPSSRFAEQAKRILPRIEEKVK